MTLTAAFDRSGESFSMLQGEEVRLVLNACVDYYMAKKWGDFGGRSAFCIGHHSMATDLSVDGGEWAQAPRVLLCVPIWHTSDYFTLRL